MNERLNMLCQFKVGPVLILGALALLACGSLQARDVTVRVPVSAAGLDLTLPSDARIFYGRLQHAAEIACTHGNRADLHPVDNYKRCYETTLAAALRSASTPLLAQIYLETHTVGQAAVYGVPLPTRLVSK